jgi:hypothetical protein
MFREVTKTPVQSGEAALLKARALYVLTPERAPGVSLRGTPAYTTLAALLTVGLRRRGFFPALLVAAWAAFS